MWEYKCSHVVNENKQLDFFFQKNENNKRLHQYPLRYI
jgi:hypothetical protein